MATNKYMQEVTVEGLIDELNFFIPEIQREYVWGNNERDILDVFCTDIKEGYKSQAGEKDLGEIISKLSKQGKFEEIKKLMEQKEISKPLNIGFLYSYQPNYRMEHFPESDLYKDVYLIDGQQRLTTLFIILFYLSIKENKKEDFVSMFRFNLNEQSLAFDYRVRNLTHNFFIDLISQTSTLQEVENIQESTWFLQEYANDPTIKAVISALFIVSSHFKNEKDEYYQYLKTRITFWHFKTEKTDQGEELYITMNSRGKQLEDSETIRAKLFEKTKKEKQLFWSEEWEKWQNLFWENRDKNKSPNNSDKGFNEFLKCISALEAFKSNSNKFLNLDEIIFVNKQLEYLTLEVIQKYYKVLKFLFEFKDEFKKQYEYSNWVDDSLNLIKKIFFEEKTNWFVNYEDDKRANERMNMVFIWSIFEYISSIENPENSLDDIFRFVRIYWVKFNNHDRSVKTIRERCKLKIENGIWNNGITYEEKKKHAYLKQIKDPTQLRNIESALWRLEDHPLNLNGYQVGNQNSSHLIDFDDSLTVENINNIYNKFIKLFKIENPVGSKKLNTILLFYGFYGMKRTPNYYDNWDFSSWRRIIRDLDSENEKVFKQFFSDYTVDNLDEILKRKRKKFIIKNKEIINSAISVIDCDNFIDTIRFYSLIVEDIWIKGRYIAFVSYEIPENTLTLFEKGIIYNTRKNFCGYGYESYWSLCEKITDNPINYLKDLANKIN